MPLNERLLRLSVAKQGEKVLVKKVRPLVELEFETKKEMFLNEFDQHPVTQEIQEGPNAFSRISSLAATGGNLFSFLGFKDSQNPISALRNYFEKNIVLGRTRAGQLRGKKIDFKTPVKFPTVKEVDAFAANSGQSKLEWTTRSFTDLLAKGIPHLSNYLFDLTKNFRNSRSGPAVQTKSPIRGGGSVQVSYVSELLSTLKRILSPKR